MKKLFLLLFMAITTATFAQNQINFESGNFDFLKDQTEVNVQFIFENATFHEKNLTEAQYLENRQKDITNKKGASTWAEWSSQWGIFKSSRYADFFLKGLNEKSKKVAFKTDVQTKYTLIVDAKWIYAGWYGGMIGSQPGKLTADLTFVETANPSKVVMKLHADKVEGNKGNKEFGWEYGRIAAAYEVTGKKLGKEIKDALKK
ncbi:hypothetical protein [Chryseobacterium arthrosphaerae]|uniref:hypothetical protein n=1 Tax=Chryseobacterium arthrosphaerae TaxID=651561 RepID=UPI001E35E568|nr:hypothetical protein [Chryseobacterium arthrosphaerae]UEQ74813.1 hypothetical protein J8N07_14180 [Chryseobacterium arthrosphaerae]